MNKHQILVLSIFAIGLIEFKAFAQQFKPTNNGVKMEKAEQAYVMKFIDGREAQIFYQLGAPVTGTVYMRQIENTCEPQRQLVRCQMEFDLRPYKIALRWTKHPDASKINHVVIASSKNGEFTYSQPAEGSINSLTWFFMHTSQAKNNMNLSNDRIRCENFDWLMQSESSPSSTEIQSWGSEAMIANEETKISENMTFQGAKGVYLKKVDEKSYIIDHFRFTYPGETPSNFPTYISAQVVNLNFRSPLHKETCQISFEVDASKIIGLISSQQYNKLDPALRPAELDYWQYSDSNVPSIIQSLLYKANTEAK